MSAPIGYELSGDVDNFGLTFQGADANNNKFGGGTHDLAGLQFRILPQKEKTLLEEVKKEYESTQRTIFHPTFA